MLASESMPAGWTYPRIRAVPTLSSALLGRAALRAARGPGRRPFPLNEPRSRLLFLGRNAVWQAMEALGLGPGDIVLMPAYHHGVEVETVLLAGARVVFYRVDEGFAPDLEQIRRQLRITGARALYVTHFIGYPQPLEELVELAREADVQLIEDCALALFSACPDGTPLGSVGDAAIFSLYKALPIPDGGVLRLARPAPAPEVRRPPWGSTLAEVGVSLVSTELLTGRDRLARAAWAAYRRARRTVPLRETLGEAAVGTNMLEPSHLGLGISPLARLVVESLSADDARRMVWRRRRNFLHLADVLGDPQLLALPPPPPMASPLFLPLRVRNGAEKDALIAALACEGVEAINFWRVPHRLLEVERFPEVARLREQVVEIPIHQSLGDEQVERIAQALKVALARVRGTHLLAS